MIDTVWLVDMAYVVKASEGRFKLDYVRAAQFLAETCGPLTTYVFNGYDPLYGIPSGLQSFYYLIRQYGMQVRLQPMQSGLPGANRQRRVDVDFSSHLVWQASLPTIETLVLTTGDQDFIPAIELAREKFGKRFICFTYDAMVHHDLVAVADEHWLFEDHAPRLVLG